MTVVVVGIIVTLLWLLLLLVLLHYYCCCCCHYLLLQHESFCSQVPLEGAPLLHLRAGLLVNQDVVDALLPIPEQETRGPRSGVLEQDMTWYHFLTYTFNLTSVCQVLDNTHALLHSFNFTECAWFKPQQYNTTHILSILKKWLLN